MWQFASEIITPPISQHEEASSGGEPVDFLKAIRPALPVAKTRQFHNPETHQ